MIMTSTTMAARWIAGIRPIGPCLALGLLLVLGNASTHAEETQPANAGAGSGMVPNRAAAGPREGLRVHGHWTIEVRDPDGKLVLRREFDNALVIPTGATHLANIMGRARTVGLWRINTLGADQICEATPGGSPAACEIVESTDGLISNTAFKTLTVGVSGSVPAELVLNGSLVAQRTGAIEQVRTFNLYCANVTSPAACPNSTAAGADMVTGTVLVSPIAVQAGQQVQVRVAITFS